MQKDSAFLDDLARMASGAAGTMLGAKREAEQWVAAQVDKLLSRMNLVSREEFDAVREMAQKARIEQEALKSRLDALENRPK